MNRSLTFLGLLGLALSGVCAVVALKSGLGIPPEGDLTKAISFDLAVGLYILTIAVYVPLAGFSDKGLRRWLGWSIWMGIYAYAVETVQTLRGLDPRFSKLFTPLDQVAGSLFGLDAIGLIVMFTILTAKLTARGTTGERGLLLLSIRYACGAVILAFAAGLWMIIIQGRKTGMSGNLLPLHAAGFHGLQAIPVLAFLLMRSDVAAGVARRLIHVAGMAWIGLCLAILMQTATGQSVTDTSVEMVFAATLLAVWLACAVFVLRSWWISPRAIYPALTDTSYRS